MQRHWGMKAQALEGSNQPGGTFGGMAGSGVVRLRSDGQGTQPLGPRSSSLSRGGGQRGSPRGLTSPIYYRGCAGHPGLLTQWFWGRKRIKDKE